MSGPSCVVCGERVLRGNFASGGEDATATAGETPALLCGMCERARPAYERALAYGPYDGALRDLIHLLKYQRVHPAAPVLGRMLADVIAGLEIEAERVLVVPVPLYEGKQRQRGFNQALEITQAAMKVLRFPPFAAQEPARQRMGHPQFCLQPERMLRIRDTVSQTGLTRHQRRENVRGAFVAVEPEKLAGATVLLVDDVFTTGTTVGECARVVARAGAEQVYVATVARVLKSDAAFAAPEVEEDEVEPSTRTMAAYA